jgi:hypothetical protein
MRAAADADAVRAAFTNNSAQAIVSTAAARKAAPGKNTGAVRAVK